MIKNIIFDMGNVLMHFDPYEGEVTTRENAMASDFSWEVSFVMFTLKLVK